MITLETSVIGDCIVSADNLIEQFEKHPKNQGRPADVARAKRLAPLYVKYGKLFKIRPEVVAWPQMEHETGFLTFTGDVKPNQNNFAGIGATGGVPGNSFKSEELGVIAHYAHLAWYFYKNHINEFCSAKYDPRHFASKVGMEIIVHPRFTGDTRLQHLAGSWAVPGVEYANRIFALAKEIEEVSQVVPSPINEKFDVIIQMGHVGMITGSTGTAGEREWNKKLGDAMEPLLKASGLHYSIIGGVAPTKQLKCKVFLSLHCDGLNATARGYTLGFKPKTNEAFKEKLAISYGKLSGFIRRKDNSTGGLRLYYMWTNHSEYAGNPYVDQRILADYYALLEHGFFTNPTERKWLEENVFLIAKHHVNIIIGFLKEVK